MLLHPREAVLKALDANHRGFAVVHHYLDVAVQQTAASWEDCYDALTDMHGATLASTVRERVRALGRRSALRSTTLRVTTVANCGQHLYDGSGTRYRILERPLSKTSPGRLLPATEPEVDTLFGTIDKLDFELAVLWAVAHKTKSLQKVVLAAIADFESQNPVIYAEEPLPPPLAVTLASAPPVLDDEAAADVDDTTTAIGFDDLFGEEEEGSGESS